MTVHMYNFIGVGTALVDNLATIGVRLTIDGERMVGDGSTMYEITSTETNSGVTQLYEFSIDGLGFVEPNTDTNGDGVGDNPFGKEVHQIEFTMDIRRLLESLGDVTRVLRCAEPRKKADLYASLGHVRARPAEGSRGGGPNPWR